MAAFFSPRPLRLQWRVSRRRNICTSLAETRSIPKPQEASLRIPPVFFVLGGPGSGKGSQCALLKRDFHLAQVCVGDLLRNEAKHNTTLGKSVHDIMQRGEIVPGHVTMALLRTQLQQLAGTCEGVLIDGFPRAMDQAEEFERMIALCEFVLFVDCPNAVMIERLLKRGTTSGRADDVEEVVLKRLNTFRKTTMPVVEHYRKRGIVHVIESHVGDVEQVYKQTKHIFEKRLTYAV